MINRKILNLVFKNEELNTILRKENPLKISKFKTASATLFGNTEFAIQNIQQSTKSAELVCYKKRLESEIINESNSSSIFGEIRALGYLINMGLDVKIIPTKKVSATSDFEINFNDTKVIVEVKTRLIDEFEKKKLNDTENDNKQLEILIAPFGYTKISEQIVENIISKLCAIKQNETQVNPKYCNILWIDLQDETLFDIDGATLCLPFSSWQNKLYSGGAYYAFYGWKGAPIFDGHEIVEEDLTNLGSMKHDGRFEKASSYDAVILSLCDSTVVFENPSAKIPIPKILKKKLLNLFKFKIEFSMINWSSENILKERIQINKKLILELSKDVKYKF